jgi:hypothetical protein
VKMVMEFNPLQILAVDWSTLHAFLCLKEAVGKKQTVNGVSDFSNILYIIE